MKIDKQMAKEIGRTLSGLLEGTALEEASARGELWAKRVLARRNTREGRLDNALLKAARNEHPGWERIGEDLALQIHPDVPEDHELIEWFRKNYPHQARAIENSILDN
ncbi:MAG: hypothetical protein JO105_22750 [Hyphomicrobiales bacterium]|nr:hypothetical protein [Hyphomicrobiales bacterium]